MNSDRDPADKIIEKIKGLKEKLPKPKLDIPHLVTKMAERRLKKSK